VTFSAESRAVYSNDPSGFAQFQLTLADGDRVVMDATGAYFLKLATFLSWVEFLSQAIRGEYTKRWWFLEGG
jgi:hypothetical protein